MGEVECADTVGTGRRVHRRVAAHGAGRHPESVNSLAAGAGTPKARSPGGIARVVQAGRGTRAGIARLAVGDGPGAFRYPGLSGRGR